MTALPSKPTSYYRELDLNRAICSDRYTVEGVTYEREYFASNPDKVIAMRMKASKTGALNCRITLTGQTPHAVKASANQLTVTGHATGDEMPPGNSASISQSAAISFSTAASSISPILPQPSRMTVVTSSKI